MPHGATMKEFHDVEDRVVREQLAPAQIVDLTPKTVWDFGK